MPAEDICIRKLNKKNTEFCSVKYSADKPKSSETFDPSKIRISQLKAYLAERGQKCVGCYEKSGTVHFAAFECRLRSQGEGGDERRVVIYGFRFFVGLFVFVMMSITSIEMESLYKRLSTWRGDASSDKHDHTGSYSLLFSGIVFSLFGVSQMTRFYSPIRIYA